MLKLYFLTYETKDGVEGVGFEVAGSAAKAMARFDRHLPGAKLNGITGGMNYFVALGCMLMPWISHKGPGIK